MPLKTLSLEDAANLLYQTGLLAEINRKVLHPMGLALSVEVNDNDKATGFAGLVDAREHPEGWTFSPESLEEGKKKLDVFMKYTGSSKLEERQKVLGYIEQPWD